jgi:hypothetical protein
LLLVGYGVWRFRQSRVKKANTEPKVENAPEKAVDIVVPETVVASVDPIIDDHTDKKSIDAIEVTVLDSADDVVVEDALEAMAEDNEVAVEDTVEATAEDDEVVIADAVEADIVEDIAVLGVDDAVSSADVLSGMSEVEKDLAASKTVSIESGLSDADVTPEKVPTESAAPQTDADTIKSVVAEPPKRKPTAFQSKG